MEQNIWNYFSVKSLRNEVVGLHCLFFSRATFDKKNNSIKNTHLKQYWQLNVPFETLYQHWITQSHLNFNQSAQIRPINHCESISPDLIQMKVTRGALERKRIVKKQAQMLSHATSSDRDTNTKEK